MASFILGITGKKRSGKDTFAQRLVSAHGFTRLGFADALKATMLDLDPWVRIESDEAGLVLGPGSLQLVARHERLSTVVNHVGWEEAKALREVRRLLQAHGVAIRDHVDPDVWVNAVARKAEQVAGRVVITDVRFPNEADFIGRQGFSGALVRVVRPGLESTDTHISETALDDYAVDHVVTNGGTIDDLYAAADRLAFSLF